MSTRQTRNVNQDNDTDQSDLVPNPTINLAAQRGKRTEDSLLLDTRRQPEAERGAFTHNDTWRVLRIMGEFVSGFDTLAEVGPAVTIFGSARTKKTEPIYTKARELGKSLAEAGFATITGGGPGIMEAANRGAYDAGAPTIGLNILLPHEQHGNPYISPGLSFKFHYFALRKMHFLMRAKALVAFPGGFGTMDELFEVLTLVQTTKIKPVPIVLYDSKFWKRLFNFELLVEEGAISPEDLTLFQYADTPEEAWQIFKDFYQLKD